MTPLPPAVRQGVEAALEGAVGRPARVRSSAPLGGGCINPSARLETDAGGTFFVKWNAAAPPGLFEAEADGLQALLAAAGSCGVHVPEVLGVGGGDKDGGGGDDGDGGDKVGGGGDDGDGGDHDGGGDDHDGDEQWLLLEFVERGRPGARYGETLGRALAELHRSAQEDAAGYGWRRDNFIGPLPQANPRSGDWPAFWRDARLAPQLVRARARGYFGGQDGRLLDRLMERVEAALDTAGADGPSLLHGDLWGGNVYPGPDGTPVLIDPAVYRGHREVDLAMSELFGGFPGGYLDAYREAWPLAPGYRQLRRPLYQLYYLLVHVNLFGASYLAGALGAAREVVAAV